MQSGQFNSNKSTIRGSREKDKPQKTNWDRVIYLSLLSVALIFIAYYLINRNFFVVGDGRVVTNELQVVAPSDIRFQKFYVEKGDSVQKSDTLFRFTFIEWKQSMDSLETLKKRMLTAAKDLEEVQNELQMKQSEAEKTSEQLRYYESRLAQVKREIKLGVSTVSDMKSLEDRIMNEKGDLTLINEKLQQLEGKRAGLVNLISDPYGNDGSELLDAARMQHMYKAPVSGIVTSVHKSESEIGLKSERVLSILSEQSQLRIKAIFHQKNGKYLSIGDKMNITFDNGEKGKGIITDIYAAETLIDRPTSSQSELEFSVQIVAELKPEDPSELNRWKAYNKMGVTVKKTIF